ncbi:MAG: diguanylate cyclase [Actinomycetota bacterium]
MPWATRSATPTSLSAAVNHGMRVVVAGAVVISVLLVSLLAWFALVSQPRITRYEGGLLALQDSHAAMLDQETGLRAFLSTGDLAYLVPYHSGLGDLAAADSRLLDVASDPRLTRSVVAMRTTQQQWQDDWATPAASGSASRPGDVAAQNDYLRAGKVLFDRYRGTQQDAVERTRSALVGARRTQFILIVTLLAAVVAVAMATVAVSIRRRDALRRDVVAPVQAVLRGLHAVSGGDLDHHVSSPGPLELIEVIDGLNAMTATLSLARTAAEDRDALIEAQNLRLQGILSMVREIGGSLNLRYVLIAITDAAIAIAAVDRVAVWLVTDDGLGIESRWDTAIGGPADAATIDLGVGVVGRAAKYGRAAHGATVLSGARGATGQPSGGASTAVPLVVGARIIGVLELGLAPGHQLGDEQIEVIETLSIHAATAIEAARLHEGAEHASEHDPLTRLANRRRLTTDLAQEVERSLRYGRPLAFLMLDLDHFKTINDTHGHARGDDVLQDVAALITDLLRSTDTAYRYGGEEIAVLVRESDAACAQVLAERLRSQIEATFGVTGETGVTASIGVAAMPTHAASAQGLIEAADTAMYAAKAQGRNRVAVAGGAAPAVLSAAP